MAAAAALLAAASALAAAPERLIPLKNGAFDPDGGAWALQPGVRYASTEERGREHVLHLKTDRPGASAKAGQDIACDPAWAIMRVTYFLSVTEMQPGPKSWNCFKMAINIKDAKGKMWYLGAGEVRQAFKGWRRMQFDVPIPEGAKTIQFSPAIFESQGEAFVDDLKAEILINRGEMVDAPPRKDLPPRWGEEPVEEEGPARATVCLNGVWRFMPALGPAEQKPLEGGWGWMLVPRSWEPRAVADGLNEAWAAFTRDSPAGWYRRDLAVPAAWAGRRVVLDLSRISTDAIVFVDGREAGRLAWPGGEVDLTPFVRPGRTHDLLVKVVAVSSNEELNRYMGMAQGQVTREKARLEQRGMIGDAFLRCRPRGATLSDVFVKTSVARGEIELEVSYRDLPADGKVAFRAVMRNAAGEAEKTFDGTAAAKKGAGVLALKWKWPDAKLWDIGSPNLYTLDLRAKGAGLEDSWRTAFGFREVRTDGRDIVLNGKKIHLRLVPMHSFAAANGIREAAAYVFKGMLANGFNAWEMEPWNRDERGKADFDYIWFEEADKAGLLVLGAAVEMSNLVAKWQEPDVADGWEARMRRVMRPHRNHPSVIAWDTSANRFGHGQDQNPEVIGVNADLGNAEYRAGAAAGRDALRRIRAFDPTRLAYSHAGAAVGDIYTSNCYLNFIDLQEREEWLSAWAAKGDLPFIPVEFGTPLYSTFHRNKMGYGNAAVSEPLYTEYCAAYFGAEAYRRETSGYRDLVGSTWEKGNRWRTWHGLAGRELLLNSPAFIDLETLFNRNTFRAWRTIGASGILPWGYGSGWLRDNPDAKGQPPRKIPMEPGRRGLWRDGVNDSLARFLAPSARLPPGDAIVENNQDALVWICGPDDGSGEAAFADKTHAYRAGDTVKKRVAVVNDARARRDYAFAWRAFVGDRLVASGDGKGSVEPGEKALVPFSFKVPEVKAGKVEGRIEVEAKVGADKTRDAFAFRAFAKPISAGRKVALVDPKGETRRLLAGLGVAATDWDGDGSAKIVVVGRGALETADRALVAKLADYVAAGGRVVLMAQSPEFFRRSLGLRVSRHLERRAFAAVADHPLLAGLDDADLADWAGASALVPANDLAKSDGWQCPPYGWRWGARHAVTSAAVEIPHFAGWTPVLRCGFDGQYTPLAAIDVGKGLVTLCTLDLEDHAARDPAAERLARNVIDWTATARRAPRAPAVYVGGEEGRRLVARLGLAHECAKALPKDGLAVIGEGAAVSDADLSAFLARGGSALVLARRAAALPLGLACAQDARFEGSAEVPDAPEFAGVWPGELRRRVAGAAWTIRAGADGIGAAGQLAVVRRGKGRAVFCQLDPELLDVKKFFYNRFTRWRMYRAISQIAANLGASFAFDPLILDPKAEDTIRLAGDGWEGAVVTPIPKTAPGAPRPADPGISDAAKRLVRPDAPSSAFEKMSAPGMFENLGGKWDTDGEVVFRRAVTIPADWAGCDLELSLDLLDDYDDTFFDGVRVGGVNSGDSAWNTPRTYTVPAALVRPGRRMLAIRIFDRFGGGGITGKAARLYIRPIRKDAAPRPAPYCEDYIEDQANGDEPYRYYRW